MHAPDQRRGSRPFSFSLENGEKAGRYGPVRRGFIFPPVLLRTTIFFLVSWIQFRRSSSFQRIPVLFGAANIFINVHRVTATR